MKLTERKIKKHMKRLKTSIDIFTLAQSTPDEFISISKLSEAYEQLELAMFYTCEKNKES